MATWSTATLSTSTSIGKIESEINSLTSTNWDNKIAIAKELIGDRLEVILTERNIRVDEAGGDVLLDVIANPTVFNLSSDYMTLHLIYDDLSQGQEGLYMQKLQKYNDYFERKFSEDVKRMNLDYDNDGTTDAYRVSWTGKLTR